MTTIIERGSDNSATVLLVGLVVVAALALYVFHIYPFNAAYSQGANPVNIQVQVPNPISPTSPATPPAKTGY